MFAMTGQYKMSAKPIIQYFEPLIDWLKKQNKGHKVTWSDECPKGTFAEPYYVPEPTTPAPQTPPTTKDPNAAASTSASVVAIVALCAAAMFL